jgi:hypothetical protein
MKAYGIRKKDDDCCPGHAKYGNPGNKRARKKSKDKPRKAKERQKKINLED